MEWLLLYPNNNTASASALDIGHCGDSRVAALLDCSVLPMLLLLALTTSSSHRTYFAPTKHQPVPPSHGIPCLSLHNNTSNSNTSTKTATSSPSHKSNTKISYLPANTHDIKNIITAALPILIPTQIRILRRCCWWWWW